MQKIKSTMTTDHSSKKSSKTKIVKGDMMSNREHILNLPDMYIGSVKNKRCEKYICSSRVDSDDEQIVLKEIDHNEGLERIFVECVSNAIDNKWESEKIGLTMTKICVTVNKDTGRTSISNDGRWIPIKKQEFVVEDEFDPKKKKTLTMYPAESYFGYVHSGTNYTSKKKKTSGKFGIGVKTTMIFSKEGTVTIIDPEMHKKYVQTFRKNLSIKEPPTITACQNKSGMVEVSYIPDFARFGLDGYSEDTINLLKRLTFECAMTTGLNVTFNGEKIKFKNLLSYVKLYLPIGANTLYLKSDNSEIVIAENTLEESRDRGFTHISYVNGVHTGKGGVHVTAWKNTILPQIKQCFNTKAEKNGLNLKAEHIKKYFKFFITADLPDPEFESASKHELVNPKPETVKPSESQVKKLLKWEFAEHFNEELDSMIHKKITKTDGKKKFMGLGKDCTDANWAGKKNKQSTILIITEGKSAKTFAEEGIYGIENGTNIYGRFAIRGKLINATNKTTLQVNQNKEIEILKNLLNLEHGKDYSTPEARATLRYGAVAILADADSDGFHIEGLCYNFFWKEYRSLILSGFVFGIPSWAVTVKIASKDRMGFYAHSDFIKWQRSHLDLIKKCKGDDIIYYKGLGSNTAKDALEMFEKLKMVKLQAQDTKEENYAMSLGFSDKFSNERKLWLKNYDPFGDTLEFNNEGKLVEKNSSIGVKDTQSIEDFIYKKLILYHRENIDRTIPDSIDGLKEVQRKILYTCFTHDISKAVVKVTDMMGSVIGTTCYHHGDNITESITKMAQGFVGAKNIPLLINQGMFGSRKEGGEDASQARYLFTKMDPITMILFDKRDNPLLTHVMDQGKKIEPERYIPILPMLLVNGAKGISSGFSTEIPPYNPKDLVHWIKAWLHKTEKPKLVPWWRGYEGEVSVKDGYLITKGKYNIIDNKLHITELPIGIWTQDYQEFLETKFLKEKMVTKIEDHHESTNSVHFIVTIKKDFDEEVLKKSLIKKRKLNNFVALSKGIPTKYSGPDDILEEFCTVRLNFYEKRKHNNLKNMRYQLLLSVNKYKFIKGINENTINIYNKSKSEVLKILKDNSFYEDKNTGFKYLLNMQINSFTGSKLVKLATEIRTVKQEIELLQKSSTKELWLQDLKIFEEGYEKFLQTRVEATKRQKKSQKKNKS